MKSVSARLTLLFVVLATVILTVFAGSLYLWVRDGHSRMLDENLRVQSRLFQDRFLEEFEETRRGVHPGVGGLRRRRTSVRLAGIPEDRAGIPP